MRALRMIQDRAAANGVSFFDKVEGDKQALNEFGIAYTLYAGHCNHCIVKEIHPVLQFQDFYDYVEGCLINGEQKAEMIVAINEFSQSQIVKTYTKDVDKEEKKTKLRGMKLKNTPLAK